MLITTAGKSKMTFKFPNIGAFCQAASPSSPLVAKKAACADL